jgi:hypothetical protein
MARQSEPDSVETFSLTPRQSPYEMEDCDANPQADDEGSNGLDSEPQPFDGGNDKTLDDALSRRGEKAVNTFLR